MLLNDIEAYSVDEMVRLALPYRTFCLKPPGVPTAIITITMFFHTPDNIPANRLIGNIYSFWPDGATFDPAVALTFRYNPRLLPTGGKEENISIVWWDINTGKWVKLETIIDTVKHTATAMISHFSMYSIMLESAPPGIEAIPKTEIPTVTENAETQSDEAIESGGIIDITDNIHENSPIKYISEPVTKPATTPSAADIAPSVISKENVRTTPAVTLDKVDKPAGKGYPVWIIYTIAGVMLAAVIVIIIRRFRWMRG
jgi:WD40 repeat protein